MRVIPYELTQNPVQTNIGRVSIDRRYPVPDRIIKIPEGIEIIRLPYKADIPTQTGISDFDEFDKVVNEDSAVINGIYQSLTDRLSLAISGKTEDEIIFHLNKARITSAELRDKLADFYKDVELSEFQPIVLSVWRNTEIILEELSKIIRFKSTFLSKYDIAENGRTIAEELKNAKVEFQEVVAKMLGKMESKRSPIPYGFGDVSGNISYLDTLGIISQYKGVAFPELQQISIDITKVPAEYQLYVGVITDLYNRNVERYTNMKNAFGNVVNKFIAKTEDEELVRYFGEWAAKGQAYREEAENDIKNIKKYSTAFSTETKGITDALNVLMGKYNAMSNCFLGMFTNGVEQSLYTLRNAVQDLYDTELGILGAIQKSLEALGAGLKYVYKAAGGEELTKILKFVAWTVGLSVPVYLGVKIYKGYKK